MSPIVTRIAVTTAAILALAAPPALAGQGHHAKHDRTLRFATFNASVNRNAAGQLLTDLQTGHRSAAAQRRRDHPARAARRAVGQRVRLLSRRAGGAAVPAQLPVGLPARRQADRVPLPVRQAVEHRDRVGQGPRQRRPGRDDAGHRRLRQRRVRLRRVPRQVRPRGLLAPADRLPQGAHLPALQVEGHARRAAARRPGDRRAARLVLARRAGHLPAVVQEPLGRADRGRPRRGRPLPRQPSRRRPSSTGPRIATARATTTRSASGPTTSTRPPAATSTTTAAGAAASRPASTS